MFNYGDAVILASDPNVIRYVFYIGSCTIAASLEPCSPRGHQVAGDHQAVFDNWELVDTKPIIKHRIGIK